MACSREQKMRMGNIRSPTTLSDLCLEVEYLTWLRMVNIKAPLSFGMDMEVITNHSRSNRRVLTTFWSARKTSSFWLLMDPETELRFTQPQKAERQINASPSTKPNQDQKNTSFTLTAGRFLTVPRKARKTEHRWSNGTITEVKIKDGISVSPITSHLHHQSKIDFILSHHFIENNVVYFYEIDMFKVLIRGGHCRPWLSLHCFSMSEKFWQ